MDLGLDWTDLDLGWTDLDLDWTDRDLGWTDLDLDCILTSIHYTKNGVYTGLNSDPPPVLICTLSNCVLLDPG